MERRKVKRVGNNQAGFTFEVDVPTDTAEMTNGAEFQNAEQVQQVIAQSKGVIETKTISTWTELASSSPYTHEATVVLSSTLEDNTIVELINNQPILFATYGFAIGEISGQNVTIYSIGQPSDPVTLKIKAGG